MGRRIARALAVALLGLSLAAPLGSRAAPRTRVVPLSLWIARFEGAPAVPEAFVREQLEGANRVFAPLSIRFEAVARRSIDERHARLETRADRDALAAHRHEGAIDVFFVERLRDVDEPERLRMGVHWRYRKDRAIHYVVVSRIALPDVLAHELGHFFGNPHSDTPGNIMSYDRPPGVAPSFDAAQRRRIERMLREYVRRGEVRLGE
ncbi:MAG: hypothetical protein GXY23_11510 [Myxococcales bacterium]|nr:hypothetical protein [Myxococcales bacterium]